MNNFEYSNPTRLVFGKGEESRIGELMRARVPAMSPVLVAYGGGSAKASGPVPYTHLTLLTNRVVEVIVDVFLLQVTTSGPDSDWDWSTS